MQEETKIYQCQGECKTVIEVLYGQAQDLVCCGQPMIALQAQQEGEKAPTHKPQFHQTDTGIKVNVGQVPHAMDPSHYIVWIETVADGRVWREYLKPGAKPEAEFPCKNPEAIRAFCNTHGFWKA